MSKQIFNFSFFRDSIIFLVIISFFSKELFYFDEEFLVVISFFVVFAVLFKLLSSIISRELDRRSDEISDQFVFYFKIKKSICVLLHSYYLKRQFDLRDSIALLIKGFYRYVKDLFLQKVIMLHYLYYREFVSRLGLVLFNENNYLRNELIELISPELASTSRGVSIYKVGYKFLSTK